MKTVIEMAREAGVPIRSNWAEQELARFAELVRADAIAEEREACAALADKLEWSDHKGVASAIRARGQA